MGLKTKVRLLKAVIWVGCLAPLGWLGLQTWRGELGANPIEALLHFTGLTGLIILTVTLAITPIRRLTGWNPLVKLRRPLGLFAFFWVVLHMGIYVGLDQTLMWSWIVEDVMERPYIMAGMGAFLILLPMAVTSTRGWIRRLGKNWARLHRLVYPAAGLGVLHYYWVQKADVFWPLVVAAVLGVLLGSRLPWRRWIARVTAVIGWSRATSAPLGRTPGDARS